MSLPGILVGGSFLYFLWSLRSTRTDVKERDWNIPKVRAVPFSIANSRPYWDDTKAHSQALGVATGYLPSDPWKGVDRKIVDIGGAHAEFTSAHMG